MFEGRDHCLKPQLGLHLSRNPEKESSRLNYIQICICIFRMFVKRCQCFGGDQVSKFCLETSKSERAREYPVCCSGVFEAKFPIFDVFLHFCGLQFLENCEPTDFPSMPMIAMLFVKVNDFTFFGKAGKRSLEKQRDCVFSFCFFFKQFFLISFYS